MESVKVETPHNPETAWHQWCYLDSFRGRARLVNRDAIGRNTPNAWREWLVLHCNNIECPATGIVRIGYITDLMQDAFPVPDRFSSDSDGGVS